MAITREALITRGAKQGDSLPVEKTEAPDTRGKVSAIERSNLHFLGTSVESAAATAVIFAIGAQISR